MLEEAKRRFSELVKEKEKIDQEYKALMAYLGAYGAVEKKKKGRPKKEG